MTPQIPDRTFFKIGEVAKIVGVKTHVLRYWESEFRHVRTSKTKSGQRLFRKRDIHILLAIRVLLHELRFTVAGAKDRLQELIDSGVDYESLYGKLLSGTPLSDDAARPDTSSGGSSSAFLYSSVPTPTRIVDTPADNARVPSDGALNEPSRETAPPNTHDVRDASSLSASDAEADAVPPHRDVAPTSLERSLVDDERGRDADDAMSSAMTLFPHEDAFESDSALERQRLAQEVEHLQQHVFTLSQQLEAAVEQRDAYRRAFDGVAAELVDTREALAQRTLQYTEDQLAESQAREELHQRIHALAEELRLQQLQQVEDVAGLREQLAAARAELHVLQAAQAVLPPAEVLREKEFAIEFLQLQLDDAEAALASARAQADEVERRHAVMRDEKQAAAHAADIAERERQRLALRLQDRDAEIATVMQDRERALQTLEAEHAAACDVLHHALLDAQTAYEEQSHTLRQVRIAHGIGRTERLHLEARMDALRTAHDALSTEYERMVTSHASLSTELERTWAIFEKLSAEYERTVASHAALSAEHQQTLLTLKARSDEHQRTLASLEAVSEDHQQTRVALEDMSARLAEAQAERRAMEDERDALQERLERATQTWMTERDARAKAWDDERASIEALLYESDELHARALAARDAELHAVQRALDARDRELATSMEALTDRDAQLAELRALLAERDAELLEVRRDTSALQQTLHQRDIALGVARTDLQVASGALADAHAECVALNAALDVARDEAREAHDRADADAAMRQQAHEAALAEASEALAAVEAANAQLQQALDVLNEQSARAIEDERTLAAMMVEEAESASARALLEARDKAAEELGAARAEAQRALSAAEERLHEVMAQAREEREVAHAAVQEAKDTAEREAQQRAIALGVSRTEILHLRAALRAAHDAYDAQAAHFASEHESANAAHDALQHALASAEAALAQKNEELERVEFERLVLEEALEVAQRTLAAKEVELSEVAASLASKVDAMRASEDEWAATRRASEQALARAEQEREAIRMALEGAETQTLEALELATHAEEDAGRLRDELAVLTERHEKLIAQAASAERAQTEAAERLVSSQAEHRAASIAVTMVTAELREEREKSQRLTSLLSQARDEAVRVGIALEELRAHVRSVEEARAADEESIAARIASLEEALARANEVASAHEEQLALASARCVELEDEAQQHRVEALTIESRFAQSHSAIRAAMDRLLALSDGTP